ncbi:hypothetical protein [Mycobacterium sp. DL592]|uniref:hypothetical protein n=1 Tax=Mycobacterium sp. DL592 TaxID=2675524 RepID=UPI001AB01665|nr:hypothetical protein [Mycobacterium sp. DL592]
MTLRPLHATAMAVLGAALIGGVVGCSAPSDAAPAGPGGAGGAGDPFIQCMIDNGVPAPPQGGQGGPDGHGGQPPQGGPGGQGGQPPAPPGVDQGVWDKGLQACASLAPQPPQLR